MDEQTLNKYVKLIFDIYDINNNKYINYDEFKHI